MSPRACLVTAAVTFISFANDNYYRKRLLLSELMTDGDGKKYVEKENHYELRDIHDGTVLSDERASSDDGNAFPALRTTVQKFYEGQADPGKQTLMKYDYDTKGNVNAYTDLGDETPEDDLEATITYHNIEDKYLFGSPESITVTHGGVTLRKREASIDPGTGNVTRIRQFLSEDQVAVYDLEEYDAYGNLKKITRPANAKGQRLRFEYVYDNVVHTYTEKVSNSYGYSSEAKYDYRFGQILTSTDLKGNEITYELDNVGRVRYITGPYEQGGGNKTIEFEYHPEDQVPWALTKHYDPSDPQNKLETVIFVDGLGRVLQTKKDVAMDLTNYEMISKYGDTDDMSYYKSVFTGGQSDEYLQNLKGLSEKFRVDVEADKPKIINLNKLDGPPIERAKESVKYEH